MSHTDFIGNRPGKKKSLARGNARQGVDNIHQDVMKTKEFISQADKEIKLVNIQRGLS